VSIKSTFAMLLMRSAKVNCKRRNAEQRSPRTAKSVPVRRWRLPVWVGDCHEMSEAATSSWQVRREVKLFIHWSTTEHVTGVSTTRNARRYTWTSPTWQLIIQLYVRVELPL